MLLFASLREAGGAADLPLTLAPGTPVSGVLRELERRLPDRRGLIERCALAINAEYTTPDTPLREGDVVAVIPPVSGGRD